MKNSQGTKNNDNLSQTTIPYNNQQQQQQQQKRIFRIVDFAVPADHREKLKESEKKAKYLELTRELKKKTVEHETDVYTHCN